MTNPTSTLSPLGLLRYAGERHMQCHGKKPDKVFVSQELMQKIAEELNAFVSTKTQNLLPADIYLVYGFVCKVEPRLPGVTALTVCAV